MTSAIAASPVVQPMATVQIHSVEQFDVSFELNKRPFFKRRLMMRDGSVDLFEIEQLFKFFNKQPTLSEEQRMQLKIILWIRDRKKFFEDPATGSFSMSRVATESMSVSPHASLLKKLAAVAADAQRSSSSGPSSAPVQQLELPAPRSQTSDSPVCQSSAREIPAAPNPLPPVKEFSADNAKPPHPVAAACRETSTPKLSAMQTLAMSPGRKPSEIKNAQTHAIPSKQEIVSATVPATKTRMPMVPSQMKKDDLLEKAKANLKMKGFPNPSPSQIFAECAILSVPKK